MYVYVYMYVCVYVCIYIYIHAHTYTHIHMYICYRKCQGPPNIIHKLGIRILEGLTRA